MEHNWNQITELFADICDLAEKGCKFSGNEDIMKVEEVFDAFDGLLFDLQELLGK